MAHELEITDEGKVMMAYTGETPWHKLGTRVPPDLTPEQICEAAGLNWNVEKRTSFTMVNGEKTECDSGLLIRLPFEHDPQERILSKLPNLSKWHTCQNSEAFEFFNDFVANGDMEMNTAGGLHGGQLVWALARVKESFFIKKKDEVQSYLLFTNPHRYGKSIDVRFTPIRVVCNDTLSMALNTSGALSRYTASHRQVFNPNVVKEKLGLAHTKFKEYGDRAKFLATKKYKNEDIVEYFSRVFPLNEREEGKTYKREAKKLHRGAEYSIAMIDKQPGADIAPGTFWNLYNAATYYTNHLAGKNEDSRIESLWYGASADTNMTALNVAVEMATKAGDAEKVLVKA